MVKDITSQLFSFVGWAFLPRYATSLLQSIYYRITIRAGDPHPAPGSPRYARHYRRIFILVVTSYLAYTLYEAFYRIIQDGDFYRALGVLPSADDRTIKSRFRRLAALHHPDKVQQQQHSSYNNGDPEAFFVHLRLAQDTLLDPVKKFAYDRFGQDVVVEDNKAKTMRDFLYAGLYTLLPQYGMGLIIMAIMNILWFSKWGRYWRLYTFLALFTLELSLLTHPKGTFMPAEFLPSWLTHWLNLDTFYLLPFQTLSLARTASVTLNIFISQLAPPKNAANNASSASNGGGLTEQTQRQLVQLTHLARANEMEASRLLQLGFAPFKGDRESVATLRRGMKEGLVLGSVRDSPDVKEAVRVVREQRRVEAS
ncbi:hypothetical protein AJ80_05886 [Polytolypa hystricis UAMH7299]|uniref:J domain-containing protein n=1 Tax=Polytolypa hystricis (strain UAMH7299) TaxID=1447883 RepID=A0A2B7XZC2_POLH7|nr:hypothetical protein AJ80_05886 [Polytolypa hystricis UAMH7299]